ncbi:MAG: PH domain-containing protein [Eubacteriales bacterium]|nr:PH domain-containing protein [Eubacteriales bacterium]
MKRKDEIWADRKRNFLGLPWSFTKYLLTPDRLFINTGFLNSREDEVRLYRITDITLTRSLWQKITGTGTIHCDSADQTMRNFDIKNIKKPEQTREQLSNMVEESRRANRVYTKETMLTGGFGAPVMEGPDMEHGMYGQDGPDPEDMAENH